MFNIAYYTKSTFKYLYYIVFDTHFDTNFIKKIFQQTEGIKANINIDNLYFVLLKATVIKTKHKLVAYIK